MVQQHREFSSNSDGGPFLGVLAAARSDGQSISAQIGVRTERPEDVLCRPYEQSSQIVVALFGDVSLGVALTGLALARR